MGQDYHIRNTSKNLTLSPIDFDQSGRMIAHSISGNSFLYELLYLLTNEWKGDVLFHCGDHCDWDRIPKKFQGNYKSHSKSQLSYHQHETYHFSILDEQWREMLPGMWQELVNQYVIVNYDQKIYCEIDCCPINQHGWRLCPLPLLLSNSEVIMGGDYKGWADFHRVGTWRYNRVGLELKRHKVLEGMREVTYSFVY